MRAGITNLMIIKIRIRKTVAPRIKGKREVKGDFLGGSGGGEGGVEEGVDEGGEGGGV